jgi:hypothetical protein
MHGLSKDPQWGFIRVENSARSALSHKNFGAQKLLPKILSVDYRICNIICYWHLVQFSIGVELKIQTYLNFEHAWLVNNQSC